MSFKVFVPMPDDTVEVKGRLVPFNPAFLDGKRCIDRKPRNWISDNDYTAVIERLARGTPRFVTV